jgi:hypothetical protein
MTPNQKHAALIHKIADGWIDCPEKAAILAGAAALTATDKTTQGRWRISRGPTRDYFVPVDQWDEWMAWCLSREVGEYDAIPPEWAVKAPANMVITGWELP